MPKYCDAGVTARVFFQYPGEARDNIPINTCPVDVTVEMQSAKPGQCCDRIYIIKLFYKDAFPDQSGQCNQFVRGPFTYEHGIRGKIRRVYVDSYVLYQGNTIRVEYENCSGIATDEAIIGNYGRCMILDNYTIRTLDGSPDNCGAASCLFRVVDGTGQLKFERISEQCPTYQVACGSNCPEGEIECGGKCVPCNELTNQISALSARVRRL